MSASRSPALRWLHLPAAPMIRSIVLFVVLSVILSVAWPWLSRFGIGRLPGDLRWERNGQRYHLPLASLVLIGLVVTLLLRLIGR